MSIDVGLEIASAREELRRLLKEEAILHAGPGQPIMLPGGIPAPWMFYSWSATMTSRGAHLAAVCLLDRLRHFSSTQLATYGYTGMPLLSACVLLGEGRYTGLSVREERKEYGSCRRIDGPADKSRSVVILDDSLSSGTSMRKGIQALEEEGFKVEGGLCLVNFPWRGGMETLQALGYRVETLYDIWTDLEMPRPEYVPPFRQLLPERWGDERVEEGLHPARAARQVAEAYLSRGVIPHPPARFDRACDGRGGVFVSFRERESDHRLARDGFWHFDPADADPCRDLVLAAVKTVVASRGGISIETLPTLKIAVTFLGPLEKIPPRELDFARYGIVARSRAMEAKMGGALPNTQVFTNEVEQYRHARVRNARITLHEPHDLYRHTLVKCVEPGEYWLPYGFPEDPAGDWTRDPAIGQALTERARELLLAAAGRIPDQAETGTPLSDDLIPAPLFAVAVTLYHRGIAGCGVAWSGSIEKCLGAALGRALDDRRYRHRREKVPPEALGISVSILHDREWLGETTLEHAVGKLRRGLDSLSVQQGNRQAIFLPLVASHYNYSKEEMGRQLLKKAGIAAPPSTWATYQTVMWLRRGNRQWRLVFGFPERPPRDDAESRWKDEITLLATYITNHLEPDGLPEYLYHPVTGGRAPRGTAPRVVHALWWLHEAGELLRESSWREAALTGFRFCLQHLRIQEGKGWLVLPGQQGGAMGDCLLLAGVAGSGGRELPAEPLQALADRVLGMFQPDGRILDHPGARGIAADHDYLPGAALLALARHAELTGDRSRIGALGPQLAWYRRRFRIAHPWGMVGWQTQGWTAIHALTGDAEAAEFVFEMADWAQDWQHRKSGAFLVELHPYGPSFHTAFLAEGIADAWSLARRVGDRSRSERYAESWREAMKFLDTLIIRPQDTFCMADPNRAVGGVRGCPSTSEVRIDYVSHALAAMVKGSRNL